MTFLISDIDALSVHSVMVFEDSCSFTSLILILELSNRMKQAVASSHNDNIKVCRKTNSRLSLLSPRREWLIEIAPKQKKLLFCKYYLILRVPNI